MIDYRSLSELYPEAVSTLEASSFDSASHQSMVHDEREVLDFDKIKQQYTANLHHSEAGIKSSDAFMTLKNGYLLIEFKNGDFSPKKIREKMRDSLLVLCDITDIHISDTRELLEFAIVYNPEKKQLTPKEKEKSVQISKEREYIKSNSFRLAKGELCRWSLDDYEGIYFKKVHTYTAEELMQFINIMSD